VAALRLRHLAPSHTIRLRMRQLRLGLAQLNPTVGDLDGNFARAVSTLGRARELGVDVLAFPEMFVTAYPPEDLLLQPSFIERTIERTRLLAPHCRGLTVVVGTVERDFDLYNAAAVLHDGEWIGSYRKRYLPNYGVFDENRYFMTARETPVFVRDGTVIGVRICEDIWYRGGPVEEQVIRGGGEVIVNLSASPYHAGEAPPASGWDVLVRHDGRRRLAAHAEAVGTRVAPRPALESGVVQRAREVVAEIYDALVLGTRGCVHKNRFEAVVLGLSGGVDSA